MGELYELPNGWEWKKLIEVSELPSVTISPNSNAYYNYVGLENITPDSGKLIDFEQTLGKNIKSTKVVFKKGMVLYGKLRPYLNKVWVANFDGIATTEILPFAPIEKILDNNYLSFYLRSSFFVDLAMNNISGARMPRVTAKFIKNESDIPLPPLSEQQKIVKKLDALFEKIDKAIALHQKNMDEADVFMGSALNEVFGEFTEKYDLKTIESFSKVGTGVTPLKSKSEYYENGTINWITSKATNFNFVYDCEQLVTDMAISRCRLKIYPIGTIIVALYGQGKTRGQVSELMIETATNQAIATIVVDENQSINRYLKYFLKKSYLDLREKASGGTQPNLNLTIIKNIKLPLPSLPVQQKVVKYLDEISEKIEKVKAIQINKMKSLKALKASILDKAFRGEL